MSKDMKIIFDISREDQIYIEEFCTKNSLSFSDLLEKLLQDHREEKREEKKPIKKKEKK